MFTKLFRFVCVISLVLTFATFAHSPVAASTAQADAPHSQIIQPAAVTQTLVSLTSPVKRGAYATIIVRTQPNTACSITVYYKSGPSSAKGLEPKTANAYGRCVWTWKVGTNTTLGTWRIVVKTGTLAKTYWFAVN